MERRSLPTASNSCSSARGTAAMLTSGRSILLRSARRRISGALWSISGLSLLSIRGSARQWPHPLRCAGCLPRTHLKTQGVMQSMMEGPGRGVV
jgi:hypothetical protein